MPRSGMRDVDATLRDGSTALTANTNTGTVRVLGTPLGGLSVVVNVPAAVSNTTLDINIRASNEANGANSVVVASFPQITTPGEYIKRFYTTREYVWLQNIVAGTNANFGGVLEYLTIHDIDR